ncbi:hypothetical protein BKA70DRAFT_1404014 [Coprinopsis sp. MPI-PUGE-AT-0042]|nr:hypothetical protein BKA70DRAFT_1404014 [Coprinopsis sp. MPI-PUGE-AT-0042]
MVPSTSGIYIIQGSNGVTINGGTYANRDASTTTQYNLLVINVNSSPSLIQQRLLVAPGFNWQCIGASRTLHQGHVHHWQRDQKESVSTGSPQGPKYRMQQWPLEVPPRMRLSPKAKRG